LARKILLADDSVTAQNMGRKILADAGYEVVTVNNGSAALKKVADTKPDLIVLDVYMPGYSGLEVCQRLKEAGETSRIPILLTVGKLEPFKPEEAKRSRADGFIVKPFEASELLSALSKLEDKIVPRAESSKPGRFARAIAAVEEGRYDKSMAVEEDSGWKNRIAFPSSKKKKNEETEDVDDPAIYNPVNKDLRTVVDHPRHEAAAHEAKTDGPRVDLAALASEGLPKDVTPEEIAALAAAAAQIQAASTDGRSEEPAARHEAEPARPPVGAPAPEVKAEKEVVAKSAEAANSDGKTSDQKKSDEKSDDPDTQDDREVATTLARSPEPEEVAAPTPSPTALVEAAIAALEEESRSFPNSPEKASEPVTMAAAAGAAAGSVSSRWAAVSVGILPEEATLSLELEMQKAHAAFAAAEMSHTAAVDAASQAPVATAAATVEALAEPASASPVPVASEPESTPAPSAETVAPRVKEFEAVAAPSPEPDSAAYPESGASLPPPADSAVFPVEAISTADANIATAGETPAHESAATGAAAEEPAAKDEVTVSENAVPVPEVPALDSASSAPEAVVTSAPPEPVAATDEVESTETGNQPAISAVAAEPEFSEASAPAPEQPSEAAAPIEAAVSSETPEASGVPAAEESSAAHSAEELKKEEAHPRPADERADHAHQKDSDITATTAAAWASWRRIRESGDAGTTPASPDATASGSRDEAAMAVAAGAEKSPQDESAPSESGDPAEIANIVDSVLADLRPKIVAEISKKMGKKK